MRIRSSYFSTLPLARNSGGLHSPAFLSGWKRTRPTARSSLRTGTAKRLKPGLTRSKSRPARFPPSPAQQILPRQGWKFAARSYVPRTGTTPSRKSPTTNPIPPTHPIFPLAPPPPPPLSERGEQGEKFLKSRPLLSSGHPPHLLGRKKTRRTLRLLERRANPLFISPSPMDGGERGRNCELG